MYDVKKEEKSMKRIFLLLNFNRFEQQQKIISVNKILMHYSHSGESFEWFVHVMH